MGTKATVFCCVLVVSMWSCGGDKPNEMQTEGFVSVPAGTFMMGSPADEPCREPSSGGKETLHEVTLSRAFEISAHEITQGQFLALMGYNPAHFTSCGTSCPVEHVNWYQAAAYCNALSAQEGLTACYTCSGDAANVTCTEASAYTGQGIYACPGFRLPTEAEWEYAYRAGTTTAYYNGPNDPTKCYTCSDANAAVIGWYKCNAGETTHPVGQKQPNTWGLYDMAGNAGEWCHDYGQVDLGSSAVTDPVGSGSDARVIRGGHAGTTANPVRAAARSAGQAPTYLDRGVGLRCCRTR